MNVTVEEILQLCGSQAVQIAKLEREIALLRSAIPERELKPISEEYKEEIQRMMRDY